MHYYQFNIGDYIKQTAHLTPLEDICYRRLLDLYYETEKPIPIETDRVSRRLRLDTDLVDSILNEFFELTENGWENERCNKEIKSYQAKADTARLNGKLGGRPPKTQSVTHRNPEETGSKAKHKPININHKPLTNGKDKRVDQSSIDHEFERFWNSGIRKVNKKKTYPLFVKHLNKNARPDVSIGYLTDQLITDVRARIAAGQLGFTEMHPTTYFNGERWDDEIIDQRVQMNENGKSAYQQRVDDSIERTFGSKRSDWAYD